MLDSTSRWPRFGAVAALACALSGCFVSEQPKFALSTAAPAFGEGGRYTTWVRDAGAFVPDDTVTIRRRQDGAYDLIDEKGTAEPVSFHQIGEKRYVVQARTDERTNSYQYVILQMNDGEALLYAPECNLQNAATLETFGGERHGEECAIDRVTDPTGLFAKLPLGRPTSKLIRQ